MEIESVVLEQSQIWYLGGQVERESGQFRLLHLTHTTKEDDPNGYYLYNR